MRLLGSVLIFVTMITSIFVMAVAIMVYSTHRNFKEDADRLTAKLSDSKNQNLQLESKLRSLDNQLTGKIEASKQKVALLESERIQLVAQNTASQAELDQLRQEQRANTAAVVSTQSNNESLTTEVNTLRDANQENQQARDVAVATAIRSTDELHQAQGILTSLHERSTQLVQQLSEKISLLRENGIDPSTDPQAAAPNVRGIVKAIHRAAGKQLIEISVGADDGLKPGHTIEVYRGDHYLGRAEILKTEPDRAVGRVIRHFQKGAIQEGDHVATKFRIG
ncbi:MAG: hypothetical protein GXP26_16305 [Planctomycetes bacterium]|nr:hypothetical protein [Planctomycetota bacterium]